MEVKWIKITTNMFSDEKINYIESMPEADAVLVIWIKLLTLAGKCNANGFILLTEKIPYTTEMLAHQFNRPLNTVKLALSILEQLGMIEFLADGILNVINWAKYQSVDKLAQIRESNRKRQVKYRDKKQLETKDKKSNVTVTQRVTLRNAIDIDKDIDKDKRIKDKDVFTPFLKNIKNETLKETLQDFIDHRKEMKKPLTERAFKMLLNKLDPFSDEIKIAALKEAIINNWQSAFPKKENTFIKQKKEIALPDWYDKYQNQLKEVANKEVEKLSDKEINEIMEKMKERAV